MEGNGICLTQYCLCYYTRNSTPYIIFASPLEKNLNNAEIIKLVEQLATLTRKGLTGRKARDTDRKRLK